MSHRSSCIAAILSLLVFPAIVSAQETVAAANTKEMETKELEDKAFDLIESISARALTLHSAVNRVRVESTLADMLWTHDEKRARELMTMSTQELAGLINSADVSDPGSQEVLQLATQLRMELVDRIARHDPELALSFVKATRVPRPTSSGDRRSVQNPETQLELRLASLIAANDPERALALARSALRRGISYELSGLLSQLSQKDKQRAQSFFREIVDKIKGEDFSNNRESINVASNLLSSFRPPQADEPTYRQLIEIVASVALSDRSNDRYISQNLYNQIRPLMSEFEKYAPARVAALKQWSQSVQRTVDPNMAMYSELNEVSQKGSIDDVLALTEKYPAEMQTQIYQRATWKALGTGDVNRARQISELIADPVQRQNMQQQIDGQLMWNAVNAGKIAEALQMLGRFKTTEERVQFLIQLARSVAGKNDKKSALEVLGEAESALNSATPSAQQMRMQMELVQAYCSLDIRHSFAIIEPIIAKLNQFIAAAVVLDRVENQYLREGDWITGAGNVGGLVSSLNQSLAGLARLDFDHARATSEQIERADLRLLAQLQIVQTVLSDKTNSNCYGCLPIEKRRGGLVVVPRER